MPGSRGGGTHAPAGRRGLLTFRVDPLGRPGGKVKIMDTSKQLEALENLSRLYLAAMLRGFPTVTDRHPNRSKALATAQTANAALSAWETTVVAARAYLLKTGFPVPDSWLLADATGTIKFATEKVKGKTVYCVQVAGPDTNALGAVCDEIRIAQIRLQCTPPKEQKRHLTEPMTLKDIAQWFTCHRNQVRRLVLEQYWHESVGRKYRMRTEDMPAPYHVHHTAQPKPASSFAL